RAAIALLPSVPADGFPELYRVAFRIRQPGEASIRIDLRVHFDRDASFAQLGDHLREVADAEVDHPLEATVAKVRRIFLDRLERGCPRAGLPRPGILAGRDAADAEIGLVPVGQFPGIPGTEEEPA